MAKAKKKKTKKNNNQYNGNGNSSNIHRGYRIGALVLAIVLVVSIVAMYALR